MTKVLLAVALALTAAGSLTAWSRASVALPYFGDRDFTASWTTVDHRIGTFELVSQTGARFTDRDLAGHPHIASFIYTRCSELCPRIVSSLGRVAKALKGREVTLVSFSVTPDLDTPKALGAFGADRGIDPEQWKLVTGDRDTIYRLARESYFADDDRVRATLADPNAFLHTEKLLLVDGTGRLRGVYDATAPHDVDKLVEDAEALAGRRS
jgi:protein SCO1/2